MPPVGLLCQLRPTHMRNDRPLSRQARRFKLACWLGTHDAVQPLGAGVFTARQRFGWALRRANARKVTQSSGASVVADHLCKLDDYPLRGGREGLT